MYLGGGIFSGDVMGVMRHGNPVLTDGVGSEICCYCQSPMFTQAKDSIADVTLSVKPDAQGRYFCRLQCVYQFHEDEAMFKGLGSCTS